MAVQTVSNNKVEYDPTICIDIGRLPDLDVESLSAYCQLVDDITRGWRNAARNRRKKGKIPDHPFPGELSPWFRGMTRVKYDCEPGLLRKGDRALRPYQHNKTKIREVEEYLRNRFRTAGLPHIDRRVESDASWMFLMQHHGLPTRLLDWSKSSLTALFFAIRKHGQQGRNKTAAAVWMLEPRRLAELYHPLRKTAHCETSPRKIPDAKDSEMQPFFELSDQLQKSYPIPLIPDEVSPRLTAQSGRFTLHTYQKEGLVNFGKVCAKSDKRWYILRIKIRYRFQPSILRSLRTAGISEASITPDLDSIGREIRRRMLLGVDDLRNPV